MKLASNIFYFKTDKIVISANKFPNLQQENLHISKPSNVDIHWILPSEIPEESSRTDHKSRVACICAKIYEINYFHAYDAVSIISLEDLDFYIPDAPGLL